MKSKKGAATLYIVVGLTIFLGIMTYVFVQTSNLEVDILTYFRNIKNEYEIKTTSQEKNKILNKLQNDIQELEIITEEET
ncbi:MAG: hypothetical protein E7311_04635 [Clostridiales bacterium]|nr:hypothetical protein [Clostridiales bacterium]